MTRASARDHITPEAGDPLDLQLHGAGAAAIGEPGSPWHRRLGLSWSPGSPPAVLLLLLGSALGPGALAILTPGVLAVIDPALPVALAALGVHAALTVPMTRTARDDALLARASLEALVTALVVMGGMRLVQTSGGDTASFNIWVVAIGCGVCAATSARLPSEDNAGAQTASMRMQQLDVFLPIAAGGLMLAWVREGQLLAALLVAGQVAVLALMVAVAAWLLLSRPVSENEGRIFGVAALLLVSGLADYLALSSLFAGLVAGAFWRGVAGRAGDWLRRDVRQLQHPLVALMLLVAGAQTRLTGLFLALGLAYLALRVVGKLMGARLARLRSPARIADAGAHLVTPGVYGIALAISIVRAAGPQFEALLGIVVLGTIGSQLVAAVWRPREARA